MDRKDFSNGASFITALLSVITFFCGETNMAIYEILMAIYIEINKDEK